MTNIWVGYGPPVESGFGLYEIHVASHTLLTWTQQKIHISEVSYFAPWCANEYAKEKEKEKNRTIFTKKSWGLMPISDSLINNILVYYISIKGWFIVLSKFEVTCRLTADFHKYKYLRLSRVLLYLAEQLTTLNLDRSWVIKWDSGWRNSQIWLAVR